ncbi:MAG: hypothetical protein HYY06_21175 [Deltaproteobacteria bacterium]|nr:hypothetical protein [Deltaproteobacteria bacterium]
MKPWVFCWAAGLVQGCAVPVTLDFPVGPLEYEVSTDDLVVPAELADGNGSIATIPCNGSVCPVEGSQSSLVIGCLEGACDPEPYSFALDLPVVDLAAYGDLQSLGARISEAEVQGVQYRVSQNTLNVELPEVTLFWGPQTAASLDDATVLRLGVIPRLPAGAAPSGRVELDSEGQRALADYFVRTSTVFRVFAETTVDVGPGAPIPQGAAQLMATIDVHLAGSGEL